MRQVARKGLRGSRHGHVMARPHALLLLLLAGCSPEVLLATNPTPAATGGAGTGGSVSASGGVAGSGGTAGDLPDGGGGEGPLEPSRLLADSVADFALVQGEHGWYYGYDDGTTDTFAQMTSQATIKDYKPPSGDKWLCWANPPYWTQLFQLGGHPNGVETSPDSQPLLQRAVRRWVSTFAGDVIIKGEIAKIDVAPTDSTGVDASVIVDGTVLYSVLIRGQDGGGVIYEKSVALEVGSNVDFVIDPHESDHHDLTRFTAVIERADAPRP